MPVAKNNARGPHGPAPEKVSLRRDKLEDYLCVGELSLDGRVKPVKGALSLALSARDRGFKGILLPEENSGEAALVEGIEVLGVSSLLTTAGFLMGRVSIEPACAPVNERQGLFGEYAVDFREIKGQEFAKRAVEVAATGVTTCWSYVLS